MLRFAMCLGPRVSSSANLGEFLTPLRAAIKSYHMKTRYVAERPHHTEFHKNCPFVVSSHGHPGFE